MKLFECCSCHERPGEIGVKLDPTEECPEGEMIWFCHPCAKECLEVVPTIQ